MAFPQQCGKSSHAGARANRSYPQRRASSLLGNGMSEEGIDPGSKRKQFLISKFIDRD